MIEHENLFFKSPPSVQLKISEDGTSLLYANTEGKMDAKKGLQFDLIHGSCCMGNLYGMRHVLMVSLNVNQFKPTVYFIEDLEDVTHITEESFHFESPLAIDYTIVTIVYSPQIRDRMSL